MSATTRWSKSAPPGWSVASWSRCAGYAIRVLRPRRPSRSRAHRAEPPVATGPGPGRSTMRSSSRRRRRASRCWSAPCLTRLRSWSSRARRWSSTTSPSRARHRWWATSIREGSRTCFPAWRLRSSTLAPARTAWSTPMTSHTTARYMAASTRASKTCSMRATRSWCRWCAMRWEPRVPASPTSRRSRGASWSSSPTAMPKG